MKKCFKNAAGSKFMALFLTGCMLTGAAAGYQGSAAVKAAEQESWLLSGNRPAYASTVNGGDIPSRATDGDIATQWGAAWESSDQWLDVDLGKTAQIDHIVIKWQNPLTYASSYEIQVSDDELNWTTIYTQKNGTGGERVPDVNGNPYCVEEIEAKGSGRYVRLFARTCVSGFGVAVYEFEIYGQGGMAEKPRELPNLALNKAVSVSSTAQPWWAQPGEKAAQKAVDGNKNSNWLSEGTNDEWFQVDLGQVYRIGQVRVNWEVEFGRVYDLQVSEDGNQFTTVYRQLAGTGEPENIPMYQNARYIRMKGIAMGRGSGYSIREFEVYPYVEGDSKINPDVPALPLPQTIQAGNGSYLMDDVTLAHPRTPKYVTANVTVPIPSNDWWTSVIYTRLSDGMPALPYMFQYTDTGLGMYYASDLFTAPNNGGMDTKSNHTDLVVGASNIIGSAEARADGCGDWSVDVVFSDDSTPKLRSTLVKGSPFVYHTFSDPSSAELFAQSATGFFDGEDHAVLQHDGDSIITDHLGIEVSNTNTAPQQKQQIRSYGIYLPEGTKVSRLGNKLKFNLGSGQNYMSIGILTQHSDLDRLYENAYAFVTDTNVSYHFEQNSSLVTTEFVDTVSLKRPGFSSDTLIALMPHQWKYSSDSLTDLQYSSARGTMKVRKGNSFRTVLRFQGITPSFAEPSESGSYDRETMLTYLNTFKTTITKDYWVADPYWQGKKTHPLSMGILIAEQLGEYETRDEFIRILRKILENWLTYEGEDDGSYYMYYSPSWGTMNGQGGDHGMGINLSDHHFLWSYFTFPAAVLAAYDSDFVAEYGDMVEHLIRDSVNPDKEDTLYPYMRNFDPYEGHSWAGGYGDNQSGNNQESSSEATFAWAGLYLWGLVTGNDTYRDAGIWGFTSEVNAIEQYWFDYDADNWAEDYTSGCVGMVWGSAYTNGTYFSGNPSCIYGIHMLPVTPVLTYLGYKPEKAAAVFEAYQRDQQIYQDKVAAEGAVDPEGWFHILWPYRANSDPEAVMAGWDPDKLPEDERFNSYWYIQNMCAKGLRAVDIWADNYTSYQVFQKTDGTYSAVIWNPFDTVQFVEFRNQNGVTGSAYVLPGTTLTVDPKKHAGMPAGTVPPAPAADPAPLAVPGKLEAEAYYTNFGCSAEDCSEGGKCVGYIDSGDSLVYEINVAEEGIYHLEYRVTNGSGRDGLIRFKSDKSGSQVLTQTVVPSNGNWTTVKAEVPLKAGMQRIRLVFAQGGFNFNWFKLYTGEIPPEGGDTPGGELTGSNLAVTKPAQASTVNGNNTAANAFDGDPGTRWESEFADGQWLMVDLGASRQINGVRLHWETAAGKDYKIQVSGDGQRWEDAFVRTGGNGGTETLVFRTPVTGRYVRMNGTLRTTGYGFSLWEFEVYGEAENPVQPVNIHVEAEEFTAMQGVDTEPCAEGGRNVGWIDQGDWMEYSVAIPRDGQYQAAFRVKGWNKDAALQLCQGEKVLAEQGVYNADVWSTVTSGAFHLSAGSYTLRIKAAEGGFNLNWFELQSK